MNFFYSFLYTLATIGRRLGISFFIFSELIHSNNIIWGSYLTLRSFHSNKSTTEHRQMIMMLASDRPYRAMMRQSRDLIDDDRF